MKILFYSLSLIALVLFSRANVQAQNANDSYIFQIADQQISIPPPDGYIETASKIPAIKERYSVTESDKNVFLGFYLSEEQFNRLQSGELLDFDLYGKVSVSKRFKEAKLSEADFADFASSFKKNYPIVMNMDGKDMKSILRNLSEKLTKLDEEKTVVNLSQPVNVANLPTTKNSFGIVLLTQLKKTVGDKEAIYPMLYAMSSVIVKDKILFVYTYKQYKNEEDLETLKKFTIRWLNKILDANNQKRILIAPKSNRPQKQHP